MSQRKFATFSVVATKPPDSTLESKAGRKCSCFRTTSDNILEILRCSSCKPGQKSWMNWNEQNAFSANIRRLTLKPNSNGRRIKFKRPQKNLRHLSTARAALLESRHQLGFGHFENLQQSQTRDNDSQLSAVCLPVLLPQRKRVPQFEPTNSPTSFDARIH